MRTDWVEFVLSSHVSNQFCGKDHLDMLCKFPILPKKSSFDCWLLVSQSRN